MMNYQKEFGKTRGTAVEITELAKRVVKWREASPSKMSDKDWSQLENDIYRILCDYIDE